MKGMLFVLDYRTTMRKVVNELEKLLGIWR